MYESVSLDGTAVDGTTGMPKHLLLASAPWQSYTPPLVRDIQQHGSQFCDGSEAYSALPRQGTGQTDEAYRTLLVRAIALLDKTKRDIKSQIHSAAITAKAEKCSIDQVWLRRAKDKIDHLTREREEVRQALGDVNRRIKDRRVASHGRPKETVAEAFIRLAKARLLPEVYEDLLRDARDASETGVDDEGRISLRQGSS